jgi:hypothetical protein
MKAVQAVTSFQAGATYRKGEWAIVVRNPSRCDVYLSGVFVWPNMKISEVAANADDWVLVERERSL